MRQFGCFWNKLLNWFDRDKLVISRHIKNAMKEELGEVVIVKFAISSKHGTIAGKTQTHMIDYYNLDMIISVDYRVKSKNGVIFRRWADSVLKGMKLIKKDLSI